MEESLVKAEMEIPVKDKRGHRATRLLMLPILALLALVAMAAPSYAYGEIQDYVHWVYGPSCEWESWGTNNSASAGYGFIKNDNGCSGYNGAGPCILVSIYDSNTSTVQWLAASATCTGSGAGTSASMTWLGHTGWSYFGRKIFTENGCYQDTIFSSLASVSC